MTKFPNHRIVFMKDHVGNINDLIRVEDMSDFDEVDFFFLTIEEAVEYQKEYQKKEQKKYPNKTVCLDPIFDKEIYDYFVENDGSVLTDEEIWWSSKYENFPEWSALMEEQTKEGTHFRILPYSVAFKERKTKISPIWEINLLRKFSNDFYYKNRVIIDNDDYPEEIKEYIKKPYDTEFPMHRVRFKNSGGGEIISADLVEKGFEEYYFTIEQAVEYVNQHPGETITGSYEDDYVVDYLESKGVKYTGGRLGMSGYKN